MRRILLIHMETSYLIMLHFHIIKEEGVLNDISFTVPSGSNVAPCGTFWRRKNNNNFSYSTFFMILVVEVLQLVVKIFEILSLKVFVRV